MVIALVVLAVISTPGRRLRQAVWAQALMLAPQIVVLDPGGHGGIDTGAAGQTRGGDRKRDHFARVSVSEGVSKSERGGPGTAYPVRRQRAVGGLRTRLRLRADLVQRSQATLFLSIHGNSFPAPGEYGGAQTFFWR